MKRALAQLWGAARLKLGSIRARLTLWYVFLLAWTLVGYSAILVISLSRGLNDGLDRVLSDSARQAVGVLNGVRDDQELRQEFRRINVGTVIGLYDADGQHLIVGRSLPAPLDHPAPPSAGQSRLETVSLPDGSSWRVLVEDVNLPDQPERILMVARSAGFAEAVVNRLLLWIGVTAPLVLLLAIGGGVFLAGRALDPIDEITRAADAIGAEDLSRRLGLPRTYDEVGRLAATFDHMLDRLDRAFEHQRRFTADASHELRTPLAMLISRAGLAAERLRTAQEYRDVLREIRDEGLHMGRIVNDLLMLARADAGNVVGLKEELDAGELVVSVAEAMAPLADVRGIRLRAEAEESLVLDGDQTRLTQLLVNLLENALEHTPPGGDVVVSACQQSRYAVLQVADTGSGIAAEHLPHVFERFYRAERDGRRASSGAGLGLSLCQSIARAHGGDIRIDSNPCRGTCVTVGLPLAHPQASAASRSSGLAEPAASAVSD
jgi:heavy metal sensor kinase